MGDCACIIGQFSVMDPCLVNSVVFKGKVSLEIRLKSEERQEKRYN